MSDPVQGRRVPDGEWWDDAKHPAPWQPGEYGLSPDHGRLTAMLPTGSLAMLATQHCTDERETVRWDVTVEDDGTVTVSPSIWQHPSHGTPEWHGWLRHGVWTEA